MSRRISKKQIESLPVSLLLAYAYETIHAVQYAYGTTELAEITDNYGSAFIVYLKSLKEIQ